MKNVFLEYQLLHRLILYAGSNNSSKFMRLTAPHKRLACKALSISSKRQNGKIVIPKYKMAKSILVIPFKVVVIMVLPYYENYR